MTQQLIEARMAQIEAIAQHGIKTGGTFAALLKIIRIVRKEVD